MPSAFQLSAPAIPKVRIALIGLGERGFKTLKRYAFIKGAEITCLVDIKKERLHAANKALIESGRKPALTFYGEEAWKLACKLPNIDLVYICTEWHTHTAMAVYAMLHGKHVAVEVPAATTIDECWQLVRTAETTQKHLFMTENCCYDLFALETNEMHRLGVFGNITHCEGAYIHHLKPVTEAGDYKKPHYNWMIDACARHGGNPYPTHGIGPIAQLLRFHRPNGDRMKRLVALSSGRNSCCSSTTNTKGHINTALIQTERGVSIVLQLDVTTPRPYSRMQTVCGTEAFVQKYPFATVQLPNKEAVYNEEALQQMEQFATNEGALLWKKGHRLGVPNEMNYAMDARLIHCLNNGLPLDIDVYDAAEWSCLAELTKLSAQENGMPVEVPVFFS